jgi:hypothetical protein
LAVETYSVDPINHADELSRRSVSDAEATGDLRLTAEALLARTRCADGRWAGSLDE